MLMADCDSIALNASSMLRVCACSMSRIRHDLDQTAESADQRLA